jgi:hypothetical protein
MSSELDSVWHEVAGKQHGHPLGYQCKACDLERQLEEAQRKIKALTGLYIKHDARGHYKDDRSCAACQRDRILSKEGNE